MQYLKGGGLVHQQMRYFIAVVDQNSYFEAAEACHISQSAISQQIKALERELGVELLERHGRRFVVTPAGRYFYNQARRQMGALVRREYAQARVSRIELADLRDLLLICVTGEAWRDAEVNWWRDTVGVQSDILFAENMDAALMNVSAGIGFLPCDGDMPAAAGNHWLPILRNGLPFTRKMFAFWPDGKEATLHWEFARAVGRAIK